MVKAAASGFSVCPSTLGNWDRAGRRKPQRHPMNRYQLYRRAELEAVLRRAAREDQRDE
jgi:hypothetical protein